MPEMLKEVAVEWWMKLAGREGQQQWGSSENGDLTRLCPSAHVHSEPVVTRWEPRASASTAA